MDAVPDDADALPDLVTHAHDTHVIVIGGGIGGLVAALECAKVGMPVTLVESAPELGGTVRTAEVDGLRVDAGATAWSAGSAAVRALADELGLADRIVAPRTDETWVAGPPKGEAAPLPHDALLGIPANPWDDRVRRIIGWGGVWRAYLDRLRPPLTIGKERNLARLVRTRMGEAVLQRMVAPLSRGAYGVDPDDVDVLAAAPGLSSALTRTGSLGAAVADQLVDRPEGPAVESLDDGLGALVDALRARLTDLGAAIRTSTRATRIAAEPDARWRVTIAQTDADTAAPADPAAPADATASADARPDDLALADIVVVATGADAARGLLAPLVGTALDGIPDRTLRREVVTLVVDAPALDAAPRGAQVHPVPGTARTSGVVHQTARWERLARAAGAGRHVLSVAFDGDADTHPTTGLSEAAAAELARDEAAQLLGVPIEAVRGAHRVAFDLARPASALGHAEAAAVARAGIAARAGLAATGAWLAGSGLAAVVAHARDEAERVRQAALFGGSARA